MFVLTKPEDVRGLCPRPCSRLMGKISGLSQRFISCAFFLHEVLDSAKDGSCPKGIWATVRELNQCLEVSSDEVLLTVSY